MRIGNFKWTLNVKEATSSEDMSTKMIDDSSSLHTDISYIVSFIVVLLLELEGEN